jgi:hypothetical protein
MPILATDCRWVERARLIRANLALLRQATFEPLEKCIAPGGVREGGAGTACRSHAKWDSSHQVKLRVEDDGLVLPGGLTKDFHQSGRKSSVRKLLRQLIGPGPVV